MKARLALLICALAAACAPWPPEATALDALAAGLEAPALLPQDRLAAPGADATPGG